MTAIFVELPPYAGFGERVLRRRRTVAGEDRYGNPTFTESAEWLEGAAFDPGGSREPVEVGRTPVVTSPKVYFTASVDVTADDVLEVRGLPFQVIGRPARWVSPYGSDVGGTVVELEAVDG